ncbi:DUF1684 domain-containing protein [Reichenbachiella versicolor]|uniref:DUF1684 domain-containing protein n=1 Tax=Reichenbachiella versicolor TaxID=1821036 RepID=UPI000D6E1B1A|nr:DUF1684 domain-containing protein [Reichenbachiella versicolor]
MKKTIGGAAIIIFGIVTYSFLGNDQETLETYKERILRERIERNNFMSTSHESPFASFGDTIVELKYFPINEKFKITAKIEKIGSKEYVTLGSSNGAPIKYLKYAYAHFKIDEKPMKLLILKNYKDVRGRLFTGFADATSGESTYGAGRYIDLDFKNANRITIDFNTAYSPYCNYNDSYSCPFPPKENILPIAITAGEKDYKL